MVRIDKITITCTILIAVVGLGFVVYGTQNQSIPENNNDTKNENLISEEYVTGLSLPTKMTFVNNGILVLEKNRGDVRHITSNGTLIQDPVLHLEVSSLAESGLIGIETKGSFVYLYYTQPNSVDGRPIGNNIVKYYWNGSELTDPSFLKKLPAGEKGFHNGGAMTVGLDGIVYAVVGDAFRQGKLQNFPEGEPDDSGVIISVDPNGPYYAIGIRNSYGLTVDPITGNLWETENGPATFDEINFVNPKFNSGWAKIMGPSHRMENYELSDFKVSDLPEFDDFEYSDPEFSWEKTRDATPTAIVFPTSKIFEKYQNSLFVGDCNKGQIYRFVLNSQRDGFVFQDPSLQDLVFNPGDNNSELLVGKKYGCITDMKFGPDGYLYVVSFTNGTIFKLSPPLQ